MTIDEFQRKFGIIGKSREIRDLVDITMQVAKSDISILINGESGAGKEVFARAIHGYSSRSANSLISVNCGAIPEGILESELFGHKKGSFTGAVESRKGYFELADGGTLFLDEIAEMPLMTQVKLLRAIETREFLPIGAETVTRVDVRFIAATNKDLQEEVNAKRFREDLFFRLKAVMLNIPPLRKRPGDIEELAYYFANSYLAAKGSLPVRITPDAVEFLMEYHWPGNIRELKNTVETAIALNRSSSLGRDAFSRILKPQEYRQVNRNLPVHLNKAPEDIERDFIYRALFELKRDILELKQLLLERTQDAIVVNTPDENSVSFPDVEKRAIQEALKRTSGNKRKAALILNISERTLYRKLKEYGLG